MNNEISSISSSEPTPKYPDVVVQLTGHDGNAFAILGTVKQAMRQGGVPRPVIDQFLQTAMSGNYEHLLQTVMAYVNVE